MRRTLLIVLGCVVLVPVVAIGALFAIREPPDGPRVEAEPGVVGVEASGAYAWIVRTTHGAFLVDAGLDGTGAAILKELSSEGVSPDQVHAVLLTHGHPDHYASARLFTKAQVMAGAADVAMIAGDSTHYSPFGRIMSTLLPMPHSPNVTRALHGDELLTLDDVVVRVVATPGHSPGSLMFLYKDVLFTGDSLMRKKDGLSVAPRLFSEDGAQNLASLSRLAPLRFETVADGHAGVTRDAKRKLERLLAGH